MDNFKDKKEKNPQTNAETCLFYFCVKVSNRQTEPGENSICSLGYSWVRRRSGEKQLLHLVVGLTYLRALHFQPLQLA